MAAEDSAVSREWRRCWWPETAGRLDGRLALLAAEGHYLRRCCGCGAASSWPCSTAAGRLWTARLGW